MTIRRWRNWGRTQSCRPADYAKPSTEGEIRSVIADAASKGRRVKVVGAGHSFTDIACTDGVLVSLDRYNKVLDVDRTSNTVTVQAGIRLGELNEALATEGLSMSNLGDIAYQSVAGAISTGTHGTGTGFGNLSTFVKHLTLVCADGSTLRCSPDADMRTFRAAQVSIGALGVISTVTLQCEPAFNLRAYESSANLDVVLEQLDDLVSSNEHFEFFWFPHTPSTWTKQNNRTTDPPTPRRRWKEFRNDIIMSNIAFGALCNVGRARPEWIPGIMEKFVAPGLVQKVAPRSQGSTLVELGRARARQIARSDKVYTSVRLVRFSEMEYAIPAENAREAILGVKALIDENAFKINFPIEVRFVASDDILLSPAHGRKTCYIAVHLFRGMDYRPYFSAVEDLMMSFDGRPHWGKLHFRDAESLRKTYPKWDDFIEIRNSLDPAGLFRNSYLDRVLGVPGS